MFTYTPEVSELQEEGWYKATIIDVREKRAKSSGQAMLEVKVSVEVDGGVMPLKDYITGNAAYRLKTLCEAVGQDYSSGGFDSESVNNVACFVKLGVEDAKGDYGPRNRVWSYRHESEAPPEDDKTKAERVTAPRGSGEDEDGDIPFVFVPFLLGLVTIGGSLLT